MNHSARACRLVFIAMASLMLLSACSIFDDGDTTSYPKTDIDRRRARVGKLTGDDGLVLSGNSDSKKEAGKNPLGVNSFLWRATLDTLSFMPLASADPFGGTILTDWYEDPNAPGERFKVNALILDRQLRADSLKVSAFRQKRDKSGDWQDAPVDATMGRKLEDAVLTRARQLRVKQLGY
ncbi:MAG: DUF3576 domain-containing protein [Rickettsiales bacterium]